MKSARLTIFRSLFTWHFYFAIALLLWLAESSFGQQLIENPETPLAKNAGRILKLQEVWRIGDDSGKFYFKYPSQLQIAADGSIFVADAGQFLKFSAEGKFQKNLYKKGEGPGEIQDSFTYYLQGGSIFIQDRNSHRLWRSDLNGHFLNQVDLPSKDYRGFLGVVQNGLIFLKTVWPQPAKQTGAGKLIEIPTSPILVSLDGKSERVLYTFYPRTFLMAQGGRDWDNSILVPEREGDRIYAYHGRDYLIEVLSIARSQIILRFTRRYNKVPYVEKAWEPEFRKKFDAPKIEFESDITGLFPNGPQLWIETSTADLKNGKLIDVFDVQGRFIDSFYLGLGRTLLGARRDDIYVTEKKTDETIVILKYRIET